MIERIQSLIDGAEHVLVKLRQKDPEFAEVWEAAIVDMERAKAKLIEVDQGHWFPEKFIHHCRN